MKKKKTGGKQAVPANLAGYTFREKPERINKKGRPRKLPELDQLLAEVLGDEGRNGVTAARKILKALLNRAVRGDARCAEILLDRAYGKVSQKIETDANIRTEQPLFGPNPNDEMYRRE